MMKSEYWPPTVRDDPGANIVVHNITSQHAYLNLSQEELRYNQVKNRNFAVKPQFQVPQSSPFNWNTPSIFQQPNINIARLIPQITGTAIRRNFSYVWTSLK